MRLLDRRAARLLVDELAVRELLLDDVDLLDVAQARWPLAGLQATHAADDLGDALQHEEHAGERNHHLELIDRWAAGGDIGVLVDAPRIEREAPAGIDQRGDAGKEEQEVKPKVQRRLRARLHVAVEKVAAHMR